MKITKILSTVTQMFNIFDRYGAKVELKFDGDTEVKNFIGAFVSLFSIFLSLYLSYGTFYDFWNKTNPKLTTVASYDNFNTTFSTDNLFFSISFFSPASGIKSRAISSATNNITETSYIHPLSIQCTDCAGMTTKEMSMCSNQIWDQINLKSMSTANSKNVLSVFRNYSYCLPDNYNGTIADNKSTNEDEINPQDSTLQFYIPFSTTPVNFNSMPQNTGGLKDNTKLFDVSTKTSQTATVAPTPVVSPSNQQPSNSNRPPNNNNNNGSGSGTQPSTNNNGSGSGSGTQPSTNNNGSGSGSGTQPSTNNNQQPINNNQQPNNNNQTPNNNNQQPNNNNQQPINNNQQPTTPTTNPTQQPTSPTSPSTNPTQQTTTPTTNPTTNPSKRMLQPLPPVQSIDNNKEPKKDPVNESYDFLRSELKRQKFPKILLIHRDMEINQHGDSSNIGTNVYKLKILDYKEPILDNPYVYDVNIKQINLKIVKQGFISSNETSISYLSIESITPNKLSSSENDGVNLSFKLMSDSSTITVTYVAFTDFLGDFGAYFATTEMLAAVIASIFSEHFLKKKMVNSLFHFVINEPLDRMVFTNKKPFNTKETHNLKNETRHAEKRKELNDKGDMSSCRSYDPILNNKTKIEEIQANKVDNLLNVLEVTPVIDEKPYIIIDDFIMEKNELLEVESKISQAKDLVKKKEESQKTSINMSPMYGSQELEMVSKKLEKQREKDKFDENVKQIAEIQDLKKKRSIKYQFSNWDLLIIALCGCKCNKKRDFFQKYRVFNKCDDIIEDISDLKYQKSVVMQLNMLKKFIFNQKEIYVFNSLEKNLNLLDCEKTRKYLKDAFRYSSDFISQKYVLLENETKRSKQAKLLDEFLSVLSF